MPNTVHVAILDDHPGIVEGYLSRLRGTEDIEVVGTAAYGQDLEPLLARRPVDVLMIDVLVPTSPENRNPFPFPHALPRLHQTYPDLAILVISMFLERPLVRAVLQAGASGYLLKDDPAAFRDLAAHIRAVAAGEIRLSPQAEALARDRTRPGLDPALTSRQAEVLSLCAASPDSTTAELAVQLGISPSTVRHLLSSAYLRLAVRSRAAAIARARELALITPFEPLPPSL